MELRNNRWLILTAGVVILLFAGMIYAWSVLNIPFAEEFKWNAGEMGLNFTITICCFCIGGIVGGIAAKKFSPKTLLITSAVTVFAGFVITSRMAGNIMTLYVAYGVLCGAGIGTAYNIVVSTVLGWFPDKKGTASGCLMMGFGTSALILGPVMKYLFDDARVGWRNAYLALAITMLVVLSAGAFLIKRYIPEGDKQSSAAKSNSDTRKPAGNFSTGEMMGSPSFWKFYFFAVLACAVGMCVISFARTFSAQVGASGDMALLLVGVLSVSNGLGRILAGWLFDAFGRYKAVLAVAVSVISSVVMMILAANHGSLPLLTAGFVVVGLTYGAIPSLLAGFVSTAYGPKNFAINFSVGTTLLIPASFSSAIGGRIISVTDDYMSVLYMLLIFGAATLGLALFTRRD